MSTPQKMFSRVLVGVAIILLAASILSLFSTNQALTLHEEKFKVISSQILQEHNTREQQIFNQNEYIKSCREETADAIESVEEKTNNTVERIYGKLDIIEADIKTILRAK